jgi:2-dehydro-3-deoxyphosphooctonate aldolase (KDO 8-P synthase)
MTLTYLDNLKYKENKSFFLIAGPCVVENEEICFSIAEKIVKITDSLKIPYIFKASYRKANRSKASSFTGIGDEKALMILKEIRKVFNIPVITDIHNPFEAEIASQFVDILQIPAFLCRQTDLLEAAGRTGKPVNIKKGQFLSAEMMKFAAEKVKETDNDKILLTERGTSFGYHDLIVDFRNIPIMKKTGYPIVLDITHSLQLPNQPIGVTGGQPEMIEIIAKAGIATGADGIFIETHPDPKNALSDGANMLQLDKLEGLLQKLQKIFEVI